MPRTAVLHTQTIQSILESLEHAEITRCQDTLRSAEELILEIDPDSSYPVEFVLWRLTGDRGAEETLPIKGGVLRRDLAILVQRASEHAPIDATEDPDGALDMHEAAAALGVSVRTVQRWRNDGLVFRQIRFADGQLRLGILHGTLKAFRERTSGRLHQAAGFTRISPEEERRFLDRARSLMASGQSLNQAALEIASQSTRAHETIRQLIRRHRGERGPVRGVGGRVRRRERRLVLEGIERGFDSSQLAERLGRSTPSIRRIGAEARADRLRGLRPSWIDLPAFDQADAEHVLLGARDVVHRRTVEPRGGTLLEQVHALRETSDAPETLILPAMNLQSRIAARLIDVLPRIPPVGRLDEIETRLRRADSLRRRIGEAVLGAAIARVEQHLSSSITKLKPNQLGGWLAFCIDVVGAILEQFDPSARGEIEPRLDRRVALETDKQIALLERGAPGRSPDHGLVVAGDLWAGLERFRVLGLASRLEARLERLGPDQRALVIARFGRGLDQAMTMQELSTRFDRSSRSLAVELAGALRILHRSGSDRG